VGTEHFRHGRRQSLGRADLRRVLPAHFPGELPLAPVDRLRLRPAGRDGVWYRLLVIVYRSAVKGSSSARTRAGGGLRRANSVFDLPLKPFNLTGGWYWFTTGGRAGAALTLEEAI